MRSSSPALWRLPFLQPGRSCLPVLPGSLPHWLQASADLPFPWGALPCQPLPPVPPPTPMSLPHLTCHTYLRAPASVRALREAGLIEFIYIQMYRLIFKEFVHAVVRVGKFEICRAGQQAGNPGRISVAVLRQNSFFLKTHFSFYS